MSPAGKLKKVSTNSRCLCHIYKYELLAYINDQSTIWKKSSRFKLNAIFVFNILLKKFGAAKFNYFNNAPIEYIGFHSGLCIYLNYWIFFYLSSVGHFMIRRHLVKVGKWVTLTVENLLSGFSADRKELLTYKPRRWSNLKKRYHVARPCKRGQATMVFCLPRPGFDARALALPRLRGNALTKLHSHYALSSHPWSVLSTNMLLTNPTSFRIIRSLHSVSYLQCYRWKKYILWRRKGKISGIHQHVCVIGLI